MGIAGVAVDNELTRPSSPDPGEGVDRFSPCADATAVSEVGGVGPASELGCPTSPEPGDAFDGSSSCADAEGEVEAVVVGDAGEDADRLTAFLGRWFNDRSTESPSKIC